MTRRDFDELVRRVEARYRGRPAALERGTAAWMALGMAGLLAWLALLFSLGAVAFGLGVVLEPGVGLWVIGLGVLLLVYAISQAGVSLLAEVDPPGGRPLRPGEAPGLVEALGSLGAELGCRPFDEVRVSMDYNAGVREIPRLGLFGWPRTILEIGLPLASTLSPGELRAVLAHEFAHQSARHGRGSRRIYRLHRMWAGLANHLRRPASGRAGRAARWAVSRFVGWYWPRLHARALVLSRSQELEADRVAAGVAGGPALASALWRMECLNPWLAERFWVDFRRLADESPEPPDHLLGRMRAALESPPPAEDAARWIGRGLARATGNDDTHPAFTDRARALGQTPEEIRDAGFPPAARPSAAEALLGADLAAIERELEDRWRRGESAAWRERNRRAAAEARRKGAEPEAGPTEDIAALWESARAEFEARGVATAEPILRSILGRDPDHAGAAAVLGHHLLGRGDDDGERLLRRVVERADEGWTRPACEALADHYRATGQVDRLGEARDLLDRHDAEVAASARERSAIGPGDAFLPHGLSDDRAAALREVLASEPDCRVAWLARKDLRHAPHRPLFVLSVSVGKSAWGLGRPDRDRELARKLVHRVELPGQVLVIARVGNRRGLADKIRKLPGSEVFRRGEAGGSPADRPTAAP